MSAILQFIAEAITKKLAAEAIYRATAMERGPREKFRPNHQPGENKVFDDGTLYLVQKNGAWKRITPRRFALHANLKNHGLLRRTWKEVQKQHGL